MKSLPFGYFSAMFEYIRYRLELLGEIIDPTLYSYRYRISIHNENSFGHLLNFDYYECDKYEQAVKYIREWKKSLGKCIYDFYDSKNMEQIIIK